jgi:hypothetical protein
MPLLAVCFMLHQLSVWKIETTGYSRTAAANCHTMQFHNPEDRNLYIKQIRQDKIKKCSLLRIMHFDEKSYFLL